MSDDPQGKAHPAIHFKRLGACGNFFMVSCMEIKVKTVPFRPFLYDNLGFITPSLIKSFLRLKQEGGAVSRVNIGSLITASVTSRHTSVIFKMAGKFLFRYVAKDVNFLNV